MSEEGGRAIKGGECEGDIFIEEEKRQKGEKCSEGMTESERESERERVYAHLTN